jgi:HSP20 family protein
LALKNLEKLIAQDPILRDIVNPSLPAQKRATRSAPAVDVVETEAGWVVTMDLPGVDKSAVRVRLDGTKLVVSGEAPAREPGQVRVSERATGTFRRDFLLPFHVRPDAIRCRLQEGLLRIELPRAGIAGARDVVIE